MRLYYVIRDTSAIKQTKEDWLQLQSQMHSQPFAAALGARRSGPNEQLQADKVSLNREYRLGGIDLTDADLKRILDAEASRIDARFKQLHRQLELVLLFELRAALSSEDAARAEYLSVQVVAWGEREAAVASVQAYLKEQAALWYAQSAAEK